MEINSMYDIFDVKYKMYMLHQRQKDQVKFFRNMEYSKPQYLQKKFI